MNRIVSKVFAIFVFLMMPILGASDIGDTLTIKRTYGKDLWGYSQKEKDVATHILESTLYPQKKELTERIKGLLDAPKAEGKQESDDAMQELKEAKIELEKINRDIDDQEVIAGKKYSRLRKGALYAVSATALLGASAITYLTYLTYFEPSLRFRVELEGGLLKYLRNRTIGEPYTIKSDSELEFFNRDVNEWQPVAENEELAKRSLVRPNHELWGWRYDEISKTIMPYRRKYYFWDSKINAFRLETFEEQMSSISWERIYDWLASDRKLKTAE